LAAVIRSGSPCRSLALYLVSAIDRALASVFHKGEAE
jgi:hypothetical protein